MQKSSRLSLHWVTVCLVFTASALANYDSAAEAEDDSGAAGYEPVLEEVVVTGSRIPRSGFESLQPMMVLDGEEFDLRANLNVADTLTEQSGIGSGRSPVGNQGAQVGQNTVNFLGLGAQRTLTLVNGHRFPPSTANGLQVDYNAIPSALVERVEVISIGGAPIYGADAIAGTINVILRNDFEGLEVLGSYGQALEFRDAEDARVAVAWGIPFAAGQGNLVLTAEANIVEGLRYVDRPITEKGLNFEAPADPNSPYTLVLTEDPILGIDSLDPLPLYFGNVFFFNVFGNGIPLNILDPSSPFSAFDADGNLRPFELGQPTGSLIFFSGGDGLDINALNGLHADLERGNANAFLNYDFTDSLRLQAEGWYANSRATQLVSQPIFNSNTFGGLPFDGYGNVNAGPIPVLIDNPFLPEGSRESILTALNIVHDFNGDGQADPTIDTDGDGFPDAVGFWRGGALTNVVGDNAYSYQQDTLRVLVGLEGALTLAGRAYSWDATYSWGEVQGDSTNTDILQPHFEQAIQVVTDAHGDPACADPSGGCAPLNVIGRATPEAINFVSAQVTDRLTLTQQFLTANITGDLFALPAGHLAAAAGYAWRREAAHYLPNPFSLSGQTRSERTASGGSFDSNELYMEAVVPLMGGELDTPGVHTLEFEGAYRWVDNSKAGADPTWTAGLRYRPIESIELRGNYTRSIRAPSIVELYTPEQASFQGANDPCDARFIEGGNVPERRAANCAADGIVQPFQSIIVNASQRGTVSGNEDLSNETADSYTYGMVLRPTFAKGLVLSVDYLNIEIGGAITSLGLNAIMGACYDSADFPDEPLCDLFTRNSNGQVIDFRAGFVNIDRIESEAVRTVADYFIDLERHGDIRLNLNWLHGLNGTFTRGDGNPVDVLGALPFFEDSVTFSGIWRIGKWSLYTQFRYLGDAVFNNTDEEFTRDVKGVSPWTVVNGSVGYRLRNRHLLQINIDNLFDTDPPFAAMASGAGPSAYYPGVVGRKVRLTYQVGF